MDSSMDLSILAFVVFFAGWFLFSIPLSAAQPSYQVVARVRTPSVDPGGHLVVEFYITGSGNVTSAKLTIYFPINFLNGQDPGVIEAWSGTGTHELNRTLPFVRPSRVKKSITLVGNTIFLSTGYFLPLPQDVNQSINPPRVMGEVTYKDESGEYPPLVMYCNVSDNFFIEGDYRIEAVLTYESGGMWYTSPRPVVVHVNTIPERLWWLGALGISVTVGGLLWKTHRQLKRGAKVLWTHARDLFFR